MTPSVRKIVLRTALAITVLAGLFALGGGIFAYTYYVRVEQSLPPLSKLQSYEPSLPSNIFSRDGVKIGEIFDEKRYPVKMKDVSPFLIKAFLAAEDSRFYEHTGVDYQGFMRAGVHFVFRTGTKQGGSTITQQLAKNLLLSKERTIERKLKDMILARRIEKSMAKDQILELYLNTIFLGNNSYGVEAAARNYFRKSNKDLTLAEATLIAGLAPAPSAFSPTDHMEKAKVRQKYVLDQLVKTKFLQPAEAAKAFKQPIKVHRAESPNTLIAPYFFMEVKKQLETQLGFKDLPSKGYIIHTSLDMRIQNEATRAVLEGLKEHEDKKGFRGPLKRHGEKFTNVIKKVVNAPISDGEFERAIVVDLFPQLDAVGIVAQQGLGLLLLEDHRWALRTSKNKESQVLDFANILRIGDEIHVKKLERGSPKRIAKNIEGLKSLSDYVKTYAATPVHQGIRYYGLTDTEGVEASALVMNAQTGEVLAMVGGSSFENSQFNRATQAKRQVGSSVKPLYYGLAQDHGFSPASQLDSPPIVIGNWKPENYDKEFLGRTTLRRSLINSYNVPSIQLFQALGPDLCWRHFKRLGLDWPVADFSIALGAGEATLLQMVQAYSPFANKGVLTEAILITKITDRAGKVLFEQNDPRLRIAPIGAQPEVAEKGKKGSDKVKLTAKKENSQKISDDEEEPPLEGSLRVLSPEAAYVSMRIMQDVVRFGTATKAAGASHHTAGKTGTTNGYTDAWFIGFVPNLVGGVWVGFDDARKSLSSHGTGGKMAAPIWREVMKKAVALYPSGNWKEPPGISSVRIDPETGALATGGGGLSVPVVAGSEPGSPRARNALGLLGLGGNANPDPSNGNETTHEPPQDDSQGLRTVF
jgi:penicillin-binding protein 1A